MKKRNKKAGVCEKKHTGAENTYSSYLRDIGRIPLLSKEEELETAKLAAEGNRRAVEKLVTSNLRFVITVAKKYQGHGLHLQDLISEGNVGLMNAAKHFDVGKGYRFITYAVWWIRQAIVKAIHDKGRMIRLPCNKSRELVKAEKSESLNEKTLAMHTASKVLSLDAPLSNDGDSLTMKDFVQDEFENSPAEQAAHSILKGELETILGGLERRSAEVLRCRFGLGGMGPMTLKEVGDRYHITRERVRQIENRAMAQIESSSKDRHLDSYIA
ncbi:MAG: RNA polymerase sigma factor RpoD/SigA [Treponema sp.]|nr:RNA polymerase sigma factor RpoD/SigA [Treponema sp.]